MRDDAQRAAEQGPHPLALRLAATLHAGARVLVLGSGRGRSLPPLAARAFVLEIAAEDDALLTDHAGQYDGILSTHALLHGTQTSVADRITLLASRLRSGGRFFATFGSTADPRCGSGAYVSGGGWAPAEGDERGIVHAYFGRVELERLLVGFEDVHIAAHDVRAVVGRWAHPSPGAHPSVHWFVEARLAER